MLIYKIDLVYFTSETIARNGNEGLSIFTNSAGKSGITAQRLSASLASTGTPSHFIHAAEWTHGDLGNTHRDIYADL